MTRTLMMTRTLALVLVTAGLLLAGCTPDLPDNPAEEASYYTIEDIPIPEGVELEVGGLATLDDGNIAVSTRRGEVWLIDDPYGDAPTFTRFAHGLHEPLGLLADGPGRFYLSQRSELTLLEDTDGDRVADVYERVVEFPITGNYHEYAYGPELLPDGSMFVTLNVAWVGYGSSPVPWRGWGMRITKDGEMTPMTAGMRSPAGFGVNADGAMFVGENQGDWIGSGRISHADMGAFLGHPNSLNWSGEPDSPVRLARADVPDTGDPMHDVGGDLDNFQQPAVWFPHGLMGISTSDILLNDQGQGFGPFENQLLVADQGHSKVMRAFIEEVDGQYQGAAFPMREGFSSGILRMSWGDQSTLFVGMTSRGWASTGGNKFGLQRMKWTGYTPFEMKEVKAEPDGFTLTFTRPVDATAFANPEAYAVTGFTYMYRSQYGSPAINQEVHPVQHAEVIGDGYQVRLVLDGLREGYVHEIKLDSLASQGGVPLLHDVAYYTLNRIPDGERLAYDASASGGSGIAAAAEARSEDKRVTELPGAWGGAPDTTITIGTVPGLRFDISEIQVAPGATVRLTFNNVDDMQHNLLIVNDGMASAIGEATMAMGLQAEANQYVPNDPRVLYHTSLLQPGSSESIYFTAPAEPGVYQYVCTYPGHYITMRGTLRVGDAGPPVS
ncbi:MAG: plastocyanin/azurin family copper-binding protein [Bacteroidota bacterium]